MTVLMDVIWMKAKGCNMEDIIYKDGHYYDKYGNWIPKKVMAGEYYD